MLRTEKSVDKCLSPIFIGTEHGLLNIICCYKEVFVLKELGDYLRRTRVGNGVSLEEAAEDMELSVAQLENIENGNTKAFKDLYQLKEYISFYAKYLGLDSNMVIDTFNDFLFEKTSKISLDDIREAQRKALLKEKEEKNRIQSPYTILHKKKIDIWPILIWIGTILIALSISLLVIRNINEEPIRNSELWSSLEGYYELAY